MMVAIPFESVCDYSIKVDFRVCVRACVYVCLGELRFLAINHLDISKFDGNI